MTTLSACFRTSTFSVCGCVVQVTTRSMAQLVEAAGAATIQLVVVIAGFARRWNAPRTRIAWGAGM